ncbi:Uncharacterised protein [Dermatophilus congolensis]|uniref:Uncharacterized protein n=1 Tax=Dermatophilus congolensis TaxID=1863 RepID=A0AA46H043_9MICO|nr:hypothetical protein [Dermatophilus congolensis]STD07492.1 Uncharacterised protein [Dermatophilus congolensis]
MSDIEFQAVCRSGCVLLLGVPCGVAGLLCSEVAYYLTDWLSGMASQFEVWGAKD